MSKIVLILFIVAISLDVKSQEEDSSSTYFISLPCHTFSKLGDFWTKEFTISKTDTFVMRVETQYTADAAIISSDQLANFKNNKDYTGLIVFDGKSGCETISLSAGTYYLAIRSQVSVSNRVAMELDYENNFPGSTFVDNYLADNTILTTGQRLCQQFTIQDGYRYYIDGCNSGLQVNILRSDQVSIFKTGGAYSYYIDYEEKQCGMGPGGFEISLPSGTYYLVAYNPDAEPNAISYVLERWTE